MGWVESGWKSSFSLHRFQLQRFCTAAAFVTVPAWIPDTLHSLSLAHEVENDELKFTV